jgi:hypothetical protein
LAAEHHRRPFGRNSVAAARTAAIIFSDLADIGRDLAHAADIGVLKDARAGYAASIANFSSISRAAAVSVTFIVTSIRKRAEGLDANDLLHTIKSSLISRK